MSNSMVEAHSLLCFLICFAIHHDRITPQVIWMGNAQKIATAKQIMMAQIHRPMIFATMITTPYWDVEVDTTEYSI
jgi:hypothetical protein